MADLFLSYAAEDRARARRVATLLETRGWSVWWDRVIRPGTSFDRAIEGALEGARGVVVLWTRASVDSDWVRNEAREGLGRKILVPVLLDDVKIPLEFRAIQAARLRADGRGPDADETASFYAAIEGVLGVPVTATPGSPSRTGRPTVSRRVALVLTGTLVCSAVVALDVRRRARYRAGFLALAGALTRYTVAARNYVGAYEAAARAAVLLALKRVEAVLGKSTVDGELVETAKQSFSRLEPLKAPYDGAFEDLSQHRDKYFDGVVSAAPLWGGTTRALVAQAQKSAIDLLHYGQIKRLRELDPSITALEQHAVAAAPSLVDANEMARKIGERLTRAMRECETLLSQLEQTTRDLRREVLGVDS